MENHHGHPEGVDLKPIKGILVKKDVEPGLFEGRKTGLLNFRAIVFLLLWYLFSGCTLFLNKYILTFLKGDPTLLGEFSVIFSLIILGL